MDLGKDVFELGMASVAPSREHTLSGVAFLNFEPQKMTANKRVHEEMARLQHITLYNVNESLLSQWYKNSVRRTEIRSLMQGISLPVIPACTTSHLPEPKEKPAFLPSSSTLHQFHASGQAIVRGAENEILRQGSTEMSSRTTEWRHRKIHFCAPKRVYNCRGCNKPMTSGEHTQFRGQRYYPHVETITKEQWLTQKKAEAAAKSKLLHEHLP